ncbi:L-seryl-tRNA(Sec) kinase-like [Engraulis encrasicolus]|uniref:L-seryl-tRNA(Sec) kinase-like n=1 Tax=Engraulis encrasicolus TaxID=184585 RepID=UPI002FD7852B
MNVAQDESSQACLCLLCGLPAAGKTTLVLELSKYTTLRGWKTLPLTYDELIPQDAFGEVSTDCASHPLQTQTKWKQYRQDILYGLGQFLQDPSQEPAAHGGIRSTVLSHLSMALRSQAESPSPSQNKLLFLLDDNFYYQSMRYEVFQLARQYAVGFCQVYLQCTPELCVSRNSSRAVPLPELVILDMLKRIEPPNPEKNSWEQNSLTLSSSEKLGNHDMQSLTNLISYAFDNPVSPIIDDTEKREMDRESCANSVLHQADQTCRRLVSQAMRTAKEKNTSPENLQSLAKQLNKLKMQVLQELRNHIHQVLSINPDEAIDVKRAVNHTVDIFKKQLDTIFECSLAVKD